MNKGGVALPLLCLLPHLASTSLIHQIMRRNVTRERRRKLRRKLRARAPMLQANRLVAVQIYLSPSSPRIDVVPSLHRQPPRNPTPTRCIHILPIRPNRLSRVPPTCVTTVLVPLSPLPSSLSHRPCRLRPLAQRTQRSCTPRRPRLPRTTRYRRLRSASRIDARAASMEGQRASPPTS